jgi:hypothetical protein
MNPEHRKRHNNERQRIIYNAANWTEEQVEEALADLRVEYGVGDASDGLLTLQIYRVRIKNTCLVNYVHGVHSKQNMYFIHDDRILEIYHLMLDI